MWLLGKTAVLKLLCLSSIENAENFLRALLGFLPV